MDLMQKCYKKMFLIRTFEQAVEKYFKKGLMRGTTHCYIGQEAIAVGVLENVDINTDFIVSNHRGHGHFLTIFEDPFSLAAELMGKAEGIVNGRGGSQHICYKNYYSNGITGGMVPIAVGMGFSKKIKNEKGVVVSFLGDGAMNEGYLLEALNLSSVYNTPNIFILENNFYAMSTESRIMSGGTFRDRVKGFGIRYDHFKALDVMELYSVFKDIYEFVSHEKIPYFIEFETFRFCGHSKSDKREYVNEDMDRFWKENDPLLRLRKSLSNNIVKRIESEVDLLVSDAFKQGMNCDEPVPEKEFINVRYQI